MGRKLITWLVMWLTIWPTAFTVKAQTVGVLLNSSSTAVVGTDPVGSPGTGGTVYSTICATIGTGCVAVDPRWTAWLATVNAAAASQQYAVAYTQLIAPGFALTSSSLSCAPCMLPIDTGTLQNLSLQYQSIVNDAIIQASMGTDGTMTVTALYSPPSLAVNQFVYGTGIPPGAQITAEGSGTGGTGTYTVSPAPSSAVSSEFMFVGGLGTGWVTGSSYPIIDLSGVPHYFTPVQFMNYRTSLGVLAACSQQAWVANGNAFPGNCALSATIP